MIKIIEGSYKHAHAFSAGDLKHYAITIIENGGPVFGMCSRQEQKRDLTNALSEGKTRGATTYLLAIQPTASDFYFKLPNIKLAELFALVVWQLLAYYLAASLGCDVDRPRHIAKSVTVK